MISDFDFGSDALSYTSELDLILKPLLSNPEFRAKFRSHQSTLSNAMLESEINHKALTAFYLVDQAKGSLWHHRQLMGEKRQTRYGAVSAEQMLDWESKMPILSLMDGGIASLVESRLRKEGKMDKVMETTDGFVSSARKPFAYP